VLPVKKADSAMRGRFVNSARYNRRSSSLKMARISRLIPNRGPPSREGHLFTDNTEALIDAASVWLAEQHL
jgi:hypothetical protein